MDVVETRFPVHPWTAFVQRHADQTVPEPNEFGRVVGQGAYPGDIDLIVRFKEPAEGERSGVLTGQFSRYGKELHVTKFDGLLFALIDGQKIAAALRETLKP
jgi:hypothetical protein